ncbi:MAG: hypothetical protein ABIN67_01060 [Ferruginibacter sp.]
MLFNLFGKKREANTEKIFIDKVYISAAAKMQACLDMAKEDPATVFIAWFSDTAAKYKALFSANGIAENKIIEARYLHTSQIQNHLPVFLEHFPLHAKEMEVAEKFPENKILVLSSLDEPLFAYFGGEKIISTMKAMGVKENEAVEHPLISKSILKAQEKIAKKVTIEQPANSQQDWFDRNLKKDL